MDLNSYFDDLENLSENFSSKYEKLKQSWINELFSPEIQDHQQELAEQIQNKLQNQQEKIEQEENILKSNLMQLEADKISYVLKLYTKQRIQKVRPSFSNRHFFLTKIMIDADRRSFHALFDPK